MKTRRYLLTLLLLSSCATPGGDGPGGQCRAVAAELDQCALAMQQWQAAGTGERPACVAETEPTVTRFVDSAGQSYPDDPDSRLELERLGKNLRMIHRFLERDKTVEARLLLSRIDDRCAALP